MLSKADSKIINHKPTTETNFVLTMEARDESNGCTLKAIEGVKAELASIHQTLQDSNQNQLNVTCYDTLVGFDGQKHQTSSFSTTTNDTSLDHKKKETFK